jgi:hypothetical protein
MVVLSKRNKHTFSLESTGWKVQEQEQEQELEQLCKQSNTHSARRVQGASSGARARAAVQLLKKIKTNTILCQHLHTLSPFFSGKRPMLSSIFPPTQRQLPHLHFALITTGPTSTQFLTNTSEQRRPHRVLQNYSMHC